MSFKEPLTCPFCPFEDTDEYFILQHVETIHPENGESPFIVKASPKQEPQSDPAPSQGKSDDDYIECLCGEFCLSNEFDNHLEMHYAEGTSFDEIERTTTDASTLPSVFRGKAYSPKMQTPPSTPPPESDSPYGKSLVIRSSGQRHKSFGPLFDSCDEDRPIGDSVRKSMRRSTSPSRKTDVTRRRKDPQRLGKAELGPHADEDQMPGWLRKLLEKGAKVTVANQISHDGRILRTESVANEIRGLMPVIDQLCSQDDEVSRAYLCHSDVTHVVKMTKEGGFCGYRNIQMMISYIQDSKSEGYEHFPGRITSILQLQEMIEHAWDMGFCPLGRIETGGVSGTRKYIGTPEAQALLESLEISCVANGFNNFTKGPPYQQLLQDVEDYFLRGTTDASRKVCKTSLPPIYFQHLGHSMTIVGFERRKSGACDLLVFDPMFRPSPGIQGRIGTRFRATNPEKLLKAYRRGDSYLRKYTTFEILKLSFRPSPKTGWGLS